LAREFAEVYPNFVDQLIDLFDRIKVVDKEVGRVNGSAPYGEHRRLLGVELTARFPVSYFREKLVALQFPSFATDSPE
jgi:hypothetical protein